MSYKIQELNENNLDKIKDLYEDYRKRAFKDYMFENMPLPINDIKPHFMQGFVKGYYATLNEQPKGFLLFFKEPGFAIELNLIHTDNQDDSLDVKEALVKQLTYDANKEKDWQVISYPMIGVQSDFEKKITNFGFKTVGQTVIDFDLLDNSTLETFNNAKITELEEGIDLTIWNDSYFEQAVELIHQTFSTANDAKFDPRFKNTEGVQDIILKIAQNIYGVFIPHATTILTNKDNKLIGICFTNLTNPAQANIPLIAVDKAYQGKGYSKILLKASLLNIHKLCEKKIIAATNINATTDFNNEAAVRMYASIGFKEKHRYYHAYLENI